MEATYNVYVQFEIHQIDLSLSNKYFYLGSEVVEYRTRKTIWYIQ